MLDWSFVDTCEPNYELRTLYMVRIYNAHIVQLKQFIQAEQVFSNQNCHTDTSYLLDGVYQPTSWDMFNPWVILPHGGWAN